MLEIKKVGVFSVGKIFGLLYALMGLIFGAIFTFVSLLGAMFSQSADGLFGAMFGLGSIIFMPIMYGIMGFISGIIMAFFYNLVAGWVGGIELGTRERF